MKTLLLLIFTVTVSAQQTKSRNLLAPCEFSMTKDELMSDQLKFHCEALSNGKVFKIKRFMIKFRNHPSIFVEGSALNPRANRIAENLKKGDVVVFFDVGLIESDHFKIEDEMPIETLMVTIK